MTELIERLNELADKCEQAELDNRVLDAEIHVAVHGLENWEALTPIGSVSSAVPTYTSSIDAALTLVPEGLCSKVISWPKAAKQGGALVEGAPDTIAATPALALCAAALRARQLISRMGG